DIYSTDSDISKSDDEFAWDNFLEIKTTKNDNIDSDRNLSEESQNILEKLDNYFKGSDISDLIPILKEIELGNLGWNEIYTLIPILNEIELGKLGWNEKYNLNYATDFEVIDGNYASSSVEGK
ncbi:TPA: hypothetical protein SMP34_003783, partial [Proteus mirabilis]|nr:hypothetical protein [Proteus mirabilis]